MRRRRGTCTVLNPLSGAEKDIKETEKVLGSCNLDRVSMEAIINDSLTFLSRRTQYAHQVSKHAISHLVMYRSDSLGDHSIYPGQHGHCRLLQSPLSEFCADVLDQALSQGPCSACCSWFGRIETCVIFAC